MRAFRDHRRADGLGMSGDLTPLVFMTGGQQMAVEIIKIPCVRQRHPVIAPEVTGFALNPAFAQSFMPAYADTNSFVLPNPFNMCPQFSIKI